MSSYAPDQPFNDLPPLPPPIALDTPVLFRAALKANRVLAELKGYCQTLPNPELLLNTVALQESKDSSAIENIVTTQDELYQAIVSPFDSQPANTKEVLSYRQAIYAGWEEWKTNGFFSSKLAVAIMQRIKHTGATLRNAPGTRLANPTTKKTIYTPPAPQYLPEKLAEWERFITYHTEDIDPLIVMALMHYQFEAIHPFADGNGRTGRILNVLFLVHSGLLTMPVLYHSRHIIQHKEEYYRNLRRVTEEGAWNDWILFMLKAVEETATSTLELIKTIVRLKEETAAAIKALAGKLPAYELVELLFSYPYIKIKVLEDRLQTHRETASKYLQRLAAEGIVRPLKLGREMYYVNQRLMDSLGQ